MFAPKRLFASEEDERQFVKEALAYMSPEARSRSSHAGQFASAKSVSTWVADRPPRATAHRRSIVAESLWRSTAATEALPRPTARDRRK